MAEKNPAPNRSRRFYVPLVWVVPAVAIAVAGWMVYREWQQRGPEIKIHFSDASGLKANQTDLEHKGVSVGIVKSVTLDPDLSGVTVTLQLRKEAAGFAREGSQFWIVQPRIGLSGVSGLETIISGVHLNARPGRGAAAMEFDGLDEPPAPSVEGEGRVYQLLTDNLRTMRPGAPVRYRNFQIGEVETIQLSDSAELVAIRIRVQPAYTALVRQNTLFWNAGGIPINFSLFGGSVETASLSSMLTGAIALATPDMTAEEAPENTPFRLHAKPEDDWLTWHPRIPPTESPLVSAQEPEPPLPQPLQGMLPEQPESGKND
jgi:paraquat-inducible protein B